MGSEAEIADDYPLRRTVVMSVTVNGTRRPMKSSTTIVTASSRRRA